MTTATTTTPISAVRRLLSIGAAATIAAVGGLVAFSAPAHAAPAAGSQVWVCKYVGTPGEDERLQTGDNPIRVSGNAADKDKNGQVLVGDQFADAQGRSVIVQIGGEDPGRDICSETPPPVPTPTTAPTSPTDGKTPGAGAPHTGGEGGDVPVGLVGGGVLLVGAALVAATAERRRRVATHR
jgi:hypothetical protein